MHVELDHPSSIPSDRQGHTVGLYANGWANRHVCVPGCCPGCICKCRKEVCDPIHGNLILEAATQLFSTHWIGLDLHLNQPWFLPQFAFKYRSPYDEATD